MSPVAPLPGLLAGMVILAGRFAIAPAQQDWKEHILFKMNCLINEELSSLRHGADDSPGAKESGCKCKTG